MPSTERSDHDANYNHNAAKNNGALKVEVRYPFTVYVVLKNGTN